MFSSFLFRSSNLLGHFVGTSIKIIARLIVFFSSFNSISLSFCLPEFLFHLIPFPFRLGPKISGRDLLVVEESCNAPDSMRQVSASYSPSLPCHLLACCILSCQHVHFILHTCSSHASEHFPRCPFCNPALLCPPVFPFCLFL